MDPAARLRGLRPRLRAAAPVAARALGLALPAALVLFLASSAGGFFPLTPAVLALVLGLILVVRITVAEEPFAGLGRWVGTAVAALGLLGAWMLASMGWGAVAGRALIEFDRALLYALAALLLGSVSWRRRECEWMTWLATGAVTAVCLTSLASRLLPTLWFAGTEFASGALSYPLGYTNAQGIFAGLGLVLALHATSDQRGPWIVRVLFAGSVPVLAATLLLTFSRGAILATALAIVLYVLLGRPRGLVAAVAATVPTGGYAVLAAYRADLVADAVPVSAAALAQAEGVATSVGLAALGAMVIRAVLLAVDAGLSRVRVPRRLRLGMAGAVAAGLVVGATALALSVDLPAALAQQYQRLAVEEESEDIETRERLTAPGTSGRFEEWGVAWRQFEQAPLAGAGAGSYQTTWARHRPLERDLRDAHSIFFEAASELGVVGLGLVAAFLAAILAGLLWRARGRARPLAAALAAAWTGWVAHAAIDWDWEMPATGLPLLCLCAAALSVSAPTGGRWLSGRTVRVATGLGVLVLLVNPALVAISQVRLEDAVRAWSAGDCTTAIDRSLASLEALGVRTEPRELIGYCDARLGLHPLSEQSMRSAIARDPRGWDLWYGLGLIRGAAGLDPRPALEQARRLNPRESLIIEAQRSLRSDDPRVWEREARAAELPIPVGPGGAAAEAAAPDEDD